MTTEADARAELVALGASLVITSVYQHSSSVTEGHVISMDPPAGTLVVPDATVTLYVSLGPLPASRWTGSTPEIVEAALAATQVAQHVVMFVLLDVPGDPLYACDAGANFNWDGHEWQGLGQFGSIEAVSESLEVFAQPLRLSLSGVDPDIIASAIASDYEGSTVRVWLGILDPDTYALLDTPEEIWSGFIDFMTVEGDQNLCTVTVDCEHELRRQPVVSRWTDEDQRTRFSGDTFFDQLQNIPGAVAKWGARDIGYRGGGAGPSRKARGHTREL